jgi:ribosomal protein S18 acetylase RimI-like enzyme
MRAMTVTHLLRADLAAAADTLARAFLDDPWFRWLYRDAAVDDTGRFDLMRSFMELGAGHAINRGHAYTVERHTAVALWTAPDQQRASQADREVRDLLEAQGIDLGRVLPGFRVVQEAHPTEPHFYLDTLATRPGQQGRGLGAGLLQHLLPECDRQALPAYLESSNPRNVSLYLRHGFEPTGRIEMPDDPAVHLTAMWREPRTAERAGGQPSTGQPPTADHRTGGQS